MGLFGRKNNDTTPDAAFPFLTADEAQEVRRLAALAFAAAGHEAVIHADHLAAADGTVFGLWNVAAACKAAGKRRAWPGVVQAYVASLVNAPAGASEMAVEDVLAHAVLRVYGDETIPPEARDKLTYVRAIADGLLEAVVLDTPTTVMMLLDEDVERCGRAELWAAGMEHLVAEPLGNIERLDMPGGAVVHVVEGESVYTASKFLVLPDVLGRVYGQRAFPDGVLVAMPDRHHLLLHPIDDGSILPALQGMASMVAEFYASAVGGVSPSVYWWRDGALERLSSFDDEGHLRVDVREAFGEVLDRLATD